MFKLNCIIPEQKSILFEFTDAMKSLRDDMETIISNVKQRTEEWHTAKKGGVGGSQLATVEGLNKYETLETFLYRKCGLLRRCWTSTTAWGNLFEDVIMRYTESIYRVPVMYDNAYIKHGKYVHYSPDGVGVVDGSRVMFEFKCPKFRQLGKVPIYYEPQLWLGMAILPVDAALFIEGIFKRIDYSRLPKKTCGMIAVYTNENSNCDKFKEFYNKCSMQFEITDTQLIDFGDIGEQLFEDLLYIIDNGLATVRYGQIVNETDKVKRDIIFNDDLDYFKESFGVIPWYLDDYQVTKYNPVPNYLAKVEPKIDKIGKYIESIDHLEPIEKKAAIDEFVLDWNM